MDGIWSRVEDEFREKYMNKLNECLYLVFVLGLCCYDRSIVVLNNL